jgi:hypothetical protein
LSKLGAESELPRAFMGAQPDPPKRGLVHRFVRRILRELVGVLIAIMNLGRRFGAFLLRTEYVIDHGCDMRGACCHHVLLEWSPFLDRHPFVGKLVLWKLTRFYSFFDRGYTWEIEEGLMARVLGCHALLPDGRCGEYRTRPMFCRTYPELPLVGKPMVLKGCGYRFKRRDGRPEEPDNLVQIGRRIS